MKYPTSLLYIYFTSFQGGIRLKNYLYNTHNYAIITSIGFKCVDIYDTIYTMLDLDSPVENIPRGVAILLPKLQKMGISTVRDLLYHFPVRYQDFSQITPIRELTLGSEVVINGTIAEIKTIRTPRRGMFIIQATIEDETGTIQAVWFNQVYIRKQLTSGSRANFAGKVSEKGSKLYLSNPLHEVTQDGSTTTHTGRVIGVYPETRGLTSKGIRYFADRALKELEDIDEYIPRDVLEKNELPEINIAIYNAHFPPTLDDGKLAQKRFDFEDLFLLQLYNLREKLALKASRAHRIPITVNAIKEHIKNLPFELTPSQKRSLWEIVQELRIGHPMNRLLQGDVGSGKTIVAALSAILSAKKGFQVAFIAPTEILARQHYKNLIKIFSKFEQGTALFTAGEKRVCYGEGLENIVQKRSLIKEISDGSINIIIGTHAILQKSISFKKLALVIIDEQHRFGVRQRAELLQKQNSTPHLLSMSATPIPRTLNLTLFGDLDLSLITELPKNRKPITTRIVDPKDRDSAYEFIRNQIKNGRQVFVVCPRIEPEKPNESQQKQETHFNKSDFLKWEVKSVIEEYEKFSKKIFPDLNIQMVHGKMKSKEKESVMRDFSDGNIDILVATSVIEVGIDVPNASVMLIEGTERFGLAQLYQFRGRVGRGEHESYCFLFTDTHSRTTHTRLQSIAEAKNGLELAERDLKLRGPGEFLGEVQTGMPDIAMKALKYPRLVKSARDTAQELLTQDQSLSNHPLLKKRLEQFTKTIHWE